MMRWPWSRHDDVESTTKATIATAAVKAQALSLVGDLRVSLERLEAVLQDESEAVHTGAPRTVEEDPHDGR